jgi:hypothetical protein
MVPQEWPGFRIGQGDESRQLALPYRRGDVLTVLPGVSGLTPYLLGIYCHFRVSSPDVAN